MLVNIFFLFPAFIFSDGKLIDTKHMEGGVFGWPNALVAQRKLWSHLNLKVIKFYDSDLNLTRLVDVVFSSMDISFSINDFLNDTISKISDGFSQNNDNDGNEEGGEDNNNNNNNNLIELGTIFKKKNLISTMNLYKNSFINNLQEIHLASDDGEHTKLDECVPEDIWPNIKTLGKFFYNISPDLFDKMECDDIDKFIGEMLSFAFVVVPIVVIGILLFIFYLVYCFGCCCCCKAKDRYNPGVVSIVFFSIITACQIIAICFSIYAAVNMLYVVDYVVDGQMFKDVDFSSTLASPAINDMYHGFVAEMIEPINSTVNIVQGSIDKVFGNLTGILTDSVDNFANLSELLDAVDTINDSIAEATKNSEQFKEDLDAYIIKEGSVGEVCKEGAKNPFDSIPIDGVEQALEIKDLASSATGDIKKAINITDYAQSFKDMAQDLVGDLVTKLEDKKEENLSISAFDDLTDSVKDYEDGFDFPLKNIILPSVKASFFLFPFFMILMTTLEVMAFWTKSCCSRCIVCYCIPRFICNICFLLFGLLCTLMAFFTIVINILYDQGDDVFDIPMKKFTNENRTLIFPPINLSNSLNGMISNITIEDIQLEKPKFIKKFVDAKLGTPLSEFIDIFSMIPIHQIGGIVQKAFELPEGAIDTSSITNVVNESISGVKDQVGGQNFSQMLPLDNLTNIIDGLNKSAYYVFINQCIVETQRTNVEEQFNTTFDNYNGLLGSVQNASDALDRKMDSVYYIFESVPQNVTDLTTDLFYGMFRDIGGQIKKIIDAVEPAVNSLNPDFIIGLLNIIRVKICYQLLGAAHAFSIAAHLYMVGMGAMTILLWIRRKGMAKTTKDRDVSVSYSSYSYYSEKKKKKKGKKKKKDASGDENTSDLGLSDITDQDAKEDAEKDVSEKSDDQSNYNNPYQHESSTEQNDGVVIDFGQISSGNDDDDDDDNDDDQNNNNNENNNNNSSDDGNNNSDNNNNDIYNNNNYDNNNNEDQKINENDDESTVGNDDIDESTIKDNSVSFSNNNTNNDDDDDDDNQETYVF